MRIHFDNVQWNSRSGPNSFANNLAISLSNMGATLVEQHENPDVRLAFIHSTIFDKIPIVQRLDGVWFNSAQNFKAQNEPLQKTYDAAHTVIAQSEFDKKLIKTFFGEHKNEIAVIHNGINVKAVQSLQPLDVPQLTNVKRVWSCAASWRPHKRLNENVRYFLEHADKDDCLVIAGANPETGPWTNDRRIFFAGDLDKQLLLQLLRSTDVFLHLAWLDHCPNSVVEARAAGCHIICSSSGGTKEIAGLNSTIIEEDEWDFKPCELYNPPKLDFTRKIKGTYNVDIEITNVAKMYYEILNSKVIK
jgi:glycosyltransferase involved in cell wall biosynthesis